MPAETNMLDDDLVRRLGGLGQRLDSLRVYL
jgi:hypothetical protein